MNAENKVRRGVFPFKSTQLLVMALTFMSFGINQFTFANETAGEKAEATKDKAWNSTKKAARNVEDKTCEVINGKEECRGKKLKNDAKNLGDEGKAKAKELKNKVD